MCRWPWQVSVLNLPPRIFIDQSITQFAFAFVCTTHRYNSRGYDLNRNFPDYFTKNQKQQQPETKAVRDWIDRLV